MDVWDLGWWLARSLDRARSLRPHPRVRVYEEDGVRVIHWQRSHAKDGASGYRLDWNGLCFVWTGDGRPSKLDAKYAEGCDVYVTEMQPELVEISSGVQGVPPFLGRYTIDTHHTPGYAAGYVANQVKPRLFLTTLHALRPVHQRGGRG